MNSLRCDQLQCGPWAGPRPVRRCTNGPIPGGWDGPRCRSRGRTPGPADLLVSVNCSNQAESSLRPLARRVEMMDRPARVRIRERKPCLRLRRRLLGWKVRLLTVYSHVDGLKSLDARDGGPVCVGTTARIIHGRPANTTRGPRSESSSRAAALLPR